METFGRHLNVIDVEATCWEGSPPPGQVNEIIEVGLCVLDTHTFERLEKHSLLVRPERSSVSPFCTTLTGLTGDDVAQGLTFHEACSVLEREHRSRSRPWASWGDYDRKQFARQCDATGVPYPFGSRHLNAKEAFASARGLRRKPGMAGALTLAGLPLEGRHHRGGDDAWNIAALVADLLRSGATTLL